MIAAGLVGTMAATHAFADEKYVLPYSYYYLGVWMSNAKVEHIYLQKSDSWTPDENGWNTAILVQLNDDTSVQKGSFDETTAAWNEVYFNCANATWGLHGSVEFSQAGNEEAFNFVWPQQVEFDPVPDQSYLTLAYQAVCHLNDPSGFQQVGPIGLPQFIKDENVRWTQNPEVQ